MNRVGSTKFHTLFVVLALSLLFCGSAGAEGCVQVYSQMACYWSNEECFAAPPIVPRDEMRCITRKNFECNGDMGLVSGEQECGRYKSQSECNGKWVTGKVCGTRDGKKNCCPAMPSEPPNHGITIYYGVCRAACDNSNTALY